MANVTKTVKSSGGDYTSLNAALAGQSADLTANCGGTGGAGILTIECYAMQDTTAASTGTGYTTSASYYINITSPSSDRHDGKWNTSKYRLEAAGPTFTNHEQYTRISYLQIYSNSGYWNEGALKNSCSVPNITVTHCILKTAIVNTVMVASGILKFDYISVDPSNNYIYNNIFYDATGDYGSAIHLGDYAGNFYIYNNTFFNCTYGITTPYDAETSKYAKNNLFCSVTHPIAGTWSSGSGYNATDQSSIGYTVTGGATGDRTSQTFTFVDDDNDNFHLASNDAGARNYGTDLSGTFTTDIDGETRSGTWDIGADEYVAAGAPSSTLARGIAVGMFKGMGIGSGQYP